MPGITQWISWIIATAVAALTMISYVHGNFVNIREQQTLNSRLDRIEDKIDYIIQGEARRAARNQN